MVGLWRINIGISGRSDAIKKGTYCALLVNSISQRARILADFGEISIQYDRIEMVMAELPPFHYQHRNPLTVTCCQLVVAIHIHYFKRKRKLRLHCLQGSNHVMTQMAVLAAIDNQHHRRNRYDRRTTCCRHR